MKAQPSGTERMKVKNENLAKAAITVAMAAGVFAYGAAWTMYAELGIGMTHMQGGVGRIARIEEAMTAGACWIGFASVTVILALSQLRKVQGWKAIAVGVTAAGGFAVNLAIAPGELLWTAYSAAMAGSIASWTAMKWTKRPKRTTNRKNANPLLRK